MRSLVDLYVDGRLVDEQVNNTIDPSFDDQVFDLRFGVDRNLKRYFHGAIADIRIFDRALTPDEIMNYYLENGWQPSASSATLHKVETLPKWFGHPHARVERKSISLVDRQHDSLLDFRDRVGRLLGEEYDVNGCTLSTPLTSRSDPDRH